MDNKSQEALAERPTVNAAASGVEWWQAGLLLTVVGFLYYPVLTRLAWDWWNDPEASHGILVPLFSLYVVWHARRQWAVLPARPAGWGLIPIFGALAIMVTGVLATEFFLARSSFVFLLAGLTIYFLGWVYFRALLFPWAVLFLMIPIPALIFNHIAFPLQLLASRSAQPSRDGPRRLAKLSSSCSNAGLVLGTHDLFPLGFGSTHGPPWLRTARLVLHSWVTLRVAHANPVGMTLTVAPSQPRPGRWLLPCSR